MNPGQIGSPGGDWRVRKCLTLGVGDLCCLSESFLSALNPPVPRAVAAGEKTVQACFSSMQITARNTNDLARIRDQAGTQHKEI